MVHLSFPGVGIKHQQSLGVNGTTLRNTRTQQLMYPTTECKALAVIGSTMLECEGSLNEMEKHQVIHHNDQLGERQPQRK